MLQSQKVPDRRSFTHLFLNFNATKSRVLTYKIPFSDNPEYNHQGAEILAM